MAMTLDSLPSATAMDVESLVGKAWRGTIRVPRFQRDFRWSWEDVRRLFDSIARGYPIRSLLLWVREAHKQTVQLGALSIEAPESTDALWVVDGQQRITSLANALHPDGQADPRFALAYDLREKQQARAITRTLRQFQVPAYQVRQADQKVLQDIFDRMNNYGKRLSRSEIFSALNAGDEDSQLTIDLITERIASDLDFGTIDGNTVL